LHGNWWLGQLHRCVGWSGLEKSTEHAYGDFPDPWHSPKRIVSPESMFNLMNFPFTKSPRPFFAASAFGAADSTYPSSMAIMRLLPFSLHASSWKVMASMPDKSNFSHNQPSPSSGHLLG
jgi:hypothetical protein